MTIEYRHNDFIVIFQPLENGKCEYLVDVHDTAELESLVGRVLSYGELNYWLNNLGKYIAENRYNY